MRGRVILKGCGVLPERNILHQMSKAAYEANPTRLISGFKLIESTPTLKFYLEDKTIVVAIRGTVPTDKEDVKADASIAVNQLKSTPRYKKDMETLLNVMRKYPTNEYTYYGVGHSLGGAILDAFIDEGWIKNGVSYNPAIQPKDLKKPISNQRIYQAGDPLYNVMGRFASNVEVRQPKKKTALDVLISKVPYVGTLLNAYKSHQLSNFEGGAGNQQKLEVFRSQFNNVVPNIKKRVIDDAKQTLKRMSSGSVKARAVGLNLSMLLFPFTSSALEELEQMEDRAERKEYVVDQTKKTLEMLDSKTADEQQKWFNKRLGLPVHTKLREILPKAENTVSSTELEQTSNVAVPKTKKAFEPQVIGKGMTHRKRFLKKHNLEDKGYSIEELAEISGVDKKILQEVYNRGVGAYKTNPISVRMKGTFKKNVKAPMSQKLSKEQWGMARLYSFLDGNKKHDTDLRGGATGSTAFEDHLKQIGYSPKSYLALARKKAKEFGYNPKKLNFARDSEHKLTITDAEGRPTSFGRVGYNDFLIYSFLEKQKKVPSGEAEKNQKRFQKSHSKIKGDWKSDDYSANNLALRILW